MPVFIDLGNNDNNVGGVCTAVAAGQSGDNEAINVDEDDSMEELIDEWDNLWVELGKLCGLAKDNGEQNEDRLESHRSDQDVANICGAIDLTQPSPPREKISSTESLQLKLDEYEEKQDRVNEILQRLKYIHSKVMSNQQCKSSSASPNSRQIEKLRSKVKTLNVEVSTQSSQAKTLQTKNELLTVQLNVMKKTVSDRTVETERTKLQYETLQKTFNSMEGSYQKYMTKTSLEKKSLNEKISKLQTAYQKLSNQVGIEDMHEMEEIRHKYSRMTQQVHDMNAKYSKLQKDMSRKEREWESTHEREKKEKERLKEQAKGSLLNFSNGISAIDSGSMSFHNERRKSYGDEGKANRDERRKSSYSGGNEKRRLDAASTSSRTSLLSTLKVSAQKRSGSIHVGGSIYRTATATRDNKARSSNIIGGNQRKNSKAMDALDKASSRKCSLAKKHQPTGYGLDDDGVQIMMRTAKKRKSSSISSCSGGTISSSNGNDESARRKSSGSSTGENGAKKASSAMTSSTKSSRNRITAVHSSKEKGNITSFFSRQPVINADEDDEC